MTLELLGAESPFSHRKYLLRSYIIVITLSIALVEK